MYRPLNHGLTIKRSEVDGLGLFAQHDIPEGTCLGMSHRSFDGYLFRTPLGGFYNHSDKPNCVKRKIYNDYYLHNTRIILAGEEITVKYTFYDINGDSNERQQKNTSI